MTEISKDDFLDLAPENIIFSDKTAKGNRVIVKMITYVITAKVTYKIIFESATNEDENDLYAVNSFAAMRQHVNHLLQHS